MLLILHSSVKNNMETSIEILSKEMIKPSSPTPHHLRIHKLSLLDQLAPPIYIPLIFFYHPEMKNDADPTRKSQLLKQSLSNILTKYYPFAGRWINGNSSIDCDDSGIEYVETRVHTQLAKVIEEPSMEELKKYLPKEPLCKENIIEGASNILLSIQVNVFTCGGIAIGVCISHKVADGSSLATFMKSWADTCRGDVDQVAQPGFEFTTHFPPKDLSGFGSNIQNIGITDEKIVTKRFVFDNEKLETLKKLVASDDAVKDPTRIEAVTAFIWNHFIKLAANDEVEIDNKKTFAAVHAVNLRPRMNPPLPEHAIGNIWWHTLAITTRETDNDYHNLASRLRDSFRNINDDYIKKIQEGGEFLTSLKKSIGLYMNKDVEFCNFSSWCRFPVYEVDYGWGKPVWVCTTTLPVKNLVILMNTSCGKGIEAWVNMVEDNVSMLENDIKLLSTDVHGVEN